MNGNAGGERLEMYGTHGEIEIALEIMREAARWLIDTGRPLWRLEDLTREKILQGIAEEDVRVGWVGDEPAAAMILQWRDERFWPQALDDSGYIHKLAMRRKFAGQGIAIHMLDWARQESLRKGTNYLRLDCAGDRPKLCAFYETYGFIQVDRRMVGPYDMAFYELKLDT